MRWNWFKNWNRLDKRPSTTYYSIGDAASSEFQQCMRLTQAINISRGLYASKRYNGRKIIVRLAQANVSNYRSEQEPFVYRNYRQMVLSAYHLSRPACRQNMSKLFVRFNPNNWMSNKVKQKLVNRKITFQENFYQ